TTSSEKSSRSFTKLSGYAIDLSTSLSKRKTRLRNYPECEIRGSYDYFTSGHNCVIQIKGGVLVESSQSNESLIGRHIREPIWYMDSRCSRSMTGVKSYLHKYVEQPGPKVVFGDNSSCITEGYGSINCGAPRRDDVYVLDISSLTPNGACFFAKASEILRVYCDEKELQNFPSPYTPEQNGVAEKKNKTLIEAARTMLNRSVLSKHFWTDAVRIACYTQNRSIIVKRHDKTSYEIFWKRIPDTSYFHVYSSASKAFRVYNTRRQQIEETYHVTFDESMEAISEDMLARSMAAKLTAASASKCRFANFLSEIAPKKVSEALKHTGWIDAMQEELNQFYRNKVWTLVPLPYGKIAIGFPKGKSGTRKMSMAQQQRIKQDWSHKGIVRKKELTMMKPLHQS
ncbi:retrovirus-related pol polyprotein from transposon TNT 1-94, partial [Tanacetum coccineum]